MGEHLKDKIKQAESDAEAECKEKNSCCSSIEIKVSCQESPQMKGARKNDPVANKACNYSNTLNCQSGKWIKDKF